MILRFLLIQSLMLWQGGFLFYALVVVPIGSDVVGSVDQGFITRRVTVWMNLSGLVCLLLLAVDACMIKDIRRWRRRSRIGLTTVNFVILLLLFRCHSWLDEVLAPQDHSVKDAISFYVRHEVYLTLCGIQWFLMLILAWLTLTAWRSGDGIVKSTAPLPEPT